MFESNASWSLPAHLFMVSAWSARCARKGEPMSCRTRGGESGRTARRAAEHDGRDPALRLDRSHLSAAQAPRQLALLRPPGRRAGLQRPGRCSARRLPGRATRPGSGTRCPGSRPLRRTASCETSGRSTTFVAAAQAGTLPAVSWIVPVASDQRASAGARQPRSGVRHRRRQRDHGEPRLELDRDLPHVGRLGRLLRSRAPTGRRRHRLRHAGPGPRDQPVREAGVRRPPDAELRRVPEVHRGRLPRRRSASTREPTDAPTPVRS